MAEFEISKFDVNNNICIEASAGTGKTYTVQQIVGELLKLKPARSLENILIVTYTEKAAGELRDRIRAKIQETLVDLKSKDASKQTADDKYLSLEEQIENFEKQMALVDNAPIFTIHSFCQQTLKEFGFAAKQCDDMEMLDDSASEEFVEKWLRDDLANDGYFQQFMHCKTDDDKINFDAYAKALKKYYLNSDFKEEADIVVLDKTIDVNAVNQATRLSAKEIQEIDSIIKPSKGIYFNVKKIVTIRKYAEKINDPNNTNPISVTDDENQKAYEEYKAKVEQTKVLLDFINNSPVPSAATKQKAFDDANNRIPELVKSLEKVEKNGYATRESGYTSDFPELANKYFDKKSSEYAKFESLCKYFDDLKETLKDVKVTYTTSIKTLKTLIFEQQVPALYEAWIKYKEDNKKQDFDDMIRNVRESVCEPNSELLKKLKEKYKYAIIDEFQDTNQKQWDIFKRIFMKYDENTKTCEKEEGNSICVVGDPKQSIYAFQGADVNVYTTAINEIKESNSDDVKVDLPYSLERNFRSTNRMIEACNALFKDNRTSNFFYGNSFTFSDSHHPDFQNPDNVKLVKPDAIFEGKETQAFWIPAEEDVNGALSAKELEEPDFAKFTAKQIIECCTFDKSGKTKLQVYKKGIKDSAGNLILTNVSFSDFAVLCKAKSEMEEIKHTFTKCGIPYNHYKEANLFNGKECLDWIALFKAIAADDFSSSNRKILNECLFSAFFGIKLEDLGSSEFDSPDCSQRQTLLQWKKIAENQKWALLQESIFEKSKVEERLSKLDKLSSLTKLRQLGDYCTQYLYKNNCSINELVDHLILVSKEKSDIDTEDGNLVEKGTDFNAVQIMTVHASKGLEFPVVIAAAGVKGAANIGDGFYSYHDANNKLHINYDKKFKIGGASVLDIANYEKCLEWRRIFYVAYTRASSLMIMPWYANVENSQALEFLNTAFKGSFANNDKHLRKVLFTGNFDTDKAKQSVKEILDHIVETGTETETEESWKNKLSAFSSELKTLDTHKYSYSTLSHGKKTEHYINANDPQIDQNGDSYSKIDNSRFDENAQNVPCKYEELNLTKINENYPRGSLLGEAVHQTLEMAEFNRIGNLSDSEVLSDTKLELLIRNKFKGQGIKIDETDSKQILNQTCKIIWNTLNAKLPEICGNGATGKTFSLKELKDDEHFAELEFNLNPEIPHNAEALRDYFNGFIDLIFVREINGKKVYSVLDWKTDSMEAEDYANNAILKNHTDRHYSIQRVLYSYCLIKWLKQFNPGKTEQEIFEEQYGGIYYVFVRGVNAETSNGIYAQTWNNWADLKSAFDEIVSEKLPEVK